MKKNKKISGTDLPDDVRRGVEFVRDCTAMKPEWAVVLGSGLSAVSDRLEHWTAFPYSMIPGLNSGDVKGHANRLRIGLLSGVPLAVFEGRLHFYETLSLEQSLACIRLCSGLGIRKIILTNAAGGLNRRFKAGDLMVLQDHLNLLPNHLLPQPGAMPHCMRVNTPTYDETLSDEFMVGCARLGVRAHMGTYAGLTGPCYETKSEVEMLRRMGADAVGMSTVAEALEAVRFKIRVLAVSCISNTVGDDQGPDHESVLRACEEASERLADSLAGLLAQE
jgi:purine-nucleoside phosphorylase